MGWFDGWFGSSSNDDPLAKLDPKLREFLERESPVKFNKPPAATTDQDAPAAVTDGQTNAAAPDSAARQPSGVPSESLYQDGRYAHLWKNYRTLEAVEAETKSDHEKLMDVLDSYKERRNRIGKAALENCALEQLDWSNCMKSGDWTARMTMCRTEVRKFERCYSMQSRLLKAMGYLSTHDRQPEIEEDVQMHADTLYHRMVEQEAAIEKAKEEGRPVPKFAPVVAKPAPRSKDSDFDLSVMNPELQKKWKEQLEKLPEEERAAEEEAMKAELRAKTEMASKIQGLWQEQAKERETRKTEGKETVYDKVVGLIGTK